MADYIGAGGIGPPSKYRGGRRMGERGSFRSNPLRARQNDWRAGDRRMSHLICQRHPAGPVLKLLQPWQEWHELSIFITQLPPTVTTWDLYNRFAREGNIAYISIHESRGVRKDSATVKFCPPPKNDFWSHSKVIISTPQGDGYVVQVQPDQVPPRPITVQSPIRKMVFYPEHVTLFPQALGFGIMYSENTMMMKREQTGDLSLRIDLMRKRIVASFVVNHEDPRGIQEPMAVNHRFQVPFAQLKVMHRFDIDEERWALVLSLDCPPQFFLQNPNIRSTHHNQSLSWSEFEAWFRLTDIIDPTADLKIAAVSLNKTLPIIDIGRWTTYLFLFEKSSALLDEYHIVKSALQDFNIDIVDVDDFRTIPSAPVQVWDMIDPPKPNEAEDEMHYLMENSHRSDILPFVVRYQLEVCISRNILEQHNITSEFIRALANLANTDKERAMCILEYIAEKEKRIYDPMTIFSDPGVLGHSPKSKIPNYCAYARKATITPTTIYFSSPTVEISNRVIRKYSEYGDRFLRVQFTDELSEGRINSCADKINNDKVFTRVYRTLKNGIRIGDRLFEFLAFGNSQFRENGAYFFCPTEDLSCAQIRKWMGKFSDIKVVAKYAARLGLCFSTTRAIRNSGMKIIEIPDVKRNGSVFTDGVGKISPFLMKMIATELKLPSEPSVIQFRMGGCKGVLAVSPDAKGQEVHIRKSQTKFTAEYMGLEIIRWSCNSLATLNRQTITILSSLGVEDYVFNRMLEDQLTSYSEAIADPDKAKELLSKYMDHNNTTMAIVTMVMNGFMRSEEPFVLSLLHLWRSWSIKLLKEKARIIVERGAFVLGCTDETQTLRGHKNDIRPGVGTITQEDIEKLPQIFLQVTDRNDPKHHIVVEGLCLIGRNPSLHPGDIRVVQAIDVPALHHLRDVVVFSQLGDRDVPSMCSGGDLDGDDFFVIWDPYLLPREWNVPPMEYASPAPVPLDRAVSIDDVMSFFVKYMKSDSLPTIAHAHLAQSDYLDLSVRDPKCLTLAALHSKAVDFVKTGVPAEMPKYLRPRIWPHFMEKVHKPKEQVYRSEKILGQLYDKVQSVDFLPQYEKPFDSRILKAYAMDKDLLKTARQTKTKYDTAMRRIMAQHEIQTEFEIWTAFVLSKPRVGTDYKVQEEMGIISSALKERFKEICIEAAGGKEYKKLAPFVAAMYRVTWEELSIALHECKTTKIIGGREVPRRKMEPKSMPLISFPWLFDTILGRIATNSEPDELEDIGVPFVSRTVNPRRPRVAISDSNDYPEDYIETADGITHRGELLDLFRPDPVDSDEKLAKERYHHEDLAAINFRGPPDAEEERTSDLIDLSEEIPMVTKPNNLADTSEYSSAAERKGSIASSLDDLAGMEEKIVPALFSDLADLRLSKELAANEPTSKTRLPLSRESDAIRQVLTDRVAYQDMSRPVSPSSFRILESSHTQYNETSDNQSDAEVGRSAPGRHTSYFDDLPTLSLNASISRNDDGCDVGDEMSDCGEAVTVNLDESPYERLQKLNGSRT